MQITAAIELRSSDVRHAHRICNAPGRQGGKHRRAEEIGQEGSEQEGRRWMDSNALGGVERQHGSSEMYYFKRVRAAPPPFLHITNMKSLLEELFL